MVLFACCLTSLNLCNATNISRDTIRIHLQQNKPYAYANNDGKIEGYFPEVLDSILTPLNQPYKIILSPFSSSKIVNDTADLHIISEESALINTSNTDLSWIVLHTDKGIFYRKGLAIEKLSDIQPYNIGVCYKDVFLAKMRMMGINKPNDSVIEVSSVWDALELMEQKDIDVIIADYPLLYWLQKHSIKKSKSNKYNLLEISSLPVTYRLSIHQHNSFVSLDSINNQLEQLKRVRTFKSIYYKWVGNHEKEQVNQLKGNVRGILYILLAVIIAIIIVGTIIYKERKKQASLFYDFTNILMYLPHAVDIFEEGKEAPVFQNNCSLELAKLSPDDRNRKKYNEERIDFNRDNKKMHIIVRVDVTEIEEGRQAAEESERLKNAFLANMSHDIRTPLNAVVGFSSMISEAENEEQLKEYSDLISSNTEYLLTLIDEIIHLSQLQTNTYKIAERAPVDVVKLLHDMKTIFDNELEKAGRSGDVKIIVDSPFDSLTLLVDGNRSRRVALNLISNACKYTEKGLITLSVRYSEHTGIVQAEIRDTGVGIPASKVKDVFTPYTRIDKNRDKGFGLGLAICKAIIDTIEGDIKLESTEGVGTNVIISFSPQVIDYIHKEQ